MVRIIAALTLVTVVITGCSSQNKKQSRSEPAVNRTEHVIYGEKIGPGGPTLALTMDVFQPTQKSNGRGLIFVVSGGWVSGRNMIPMLPPDEFTHRGYTVFTVVHGSQPKYTIPEILQDMHRSVRYIRAHAADYKIDPNKLGIYGGSAGGHLSCMQGVAGTPGDPNAKDPVDRESSRVACVACFFPPTDFLNYGKDGESGLGEGILKDFAAPFDFQEFSQQTKRFERISDQTKRREIGLQISPIYHVSADDPPTLIIHGDKDFLVPIQQAQTFIDKLKAAGVDAKLVVHEGGAHGWPNWNKDLSTLADWFDQHLK